MYTQPMVFPLDLDGKIYVLQDANGQTIGTGTRDVCHVLMWIIANPAAKSQPRPYRCRPNVRAAIAI